MIVPCKFIQSEAKGSVQDSVHYSAMKKFEVVLQNEKVKTYRVISWLIIAIQFSVFLYMGISLKNNNANYAYGAAGFLLIIMLFQLFRGRKEAGKKDMFVPAFLLIVLAWIVLGYYWGAVINLLLFFFQNVTQRKLVIQFSDNIIHYPSFPRKMISWKDLNNVILKDGILTIDFKNNKLIQQPIAEGSSGINEKEFNDFCSDQLRLSVIGNLSD
jgi:hypothetical protein